MPTVVSTDGSAYIETWILHFSLFLENFCAHTKISSLRSISFDTLTGVFLIYLTKCQNKKCRLEIQNRVLGGTFFGMFQGENGYRGVKA